MLVVGSTYADQSAGPMVFLQGTQVPFHMMPHMWQASSRFVMPPAAGQLGPAGYGQY